MTICPPYPNQQVAKASSKIALATKEAASTTEVTCQPVSWWTTPKEPSLPSKMSEVPKWYYIPSNTINLSIQSPISREKCKALKSHTPISKKTTKNIGKTWHLRISIENSVREVFMIGYMILSQKEKMPLANPPCLRRDRSLWCRICWRRPIRLFRLIRIINLGFLSLTKR